MVSTETRSEIEGMLGRVPSWIEGLSDPAADHSWGIVRDLELSETALQPRDKALIGVGVAAALQCQYCTHFHTEQAKVDGASDEQITEAVNLASTIRYFSTVLHGAQVDYNEFVDETAGIVEHVKSQQGAAGGATADD
jgi:AhpD family alkylhydroperoxidase